MQHAQSICPTEDRTNDSVETPGETGVHEGHVVATAPESDRARKNRQPHPRLWAKRAAVLAALAVLAAACVAATLSFGPDLWAFVADAGRLRAWVEQNELVSATAFVSANVAQIVIAFFPGEPLELAAGYAFGFWKGTALCLLASALGTAVVMLAVRTLGMHVVHLFFSAEKIASLKWLKEQQRFELLLFLCFLVPGTPKDLLTYVAGIGSSPLWRIVAITTVGRIPSIVSSTLAAGSFGSGNYLVTGVTVVATAVLAIGGAAAYRQMAKRKQNQTTKDSDF